MKTGSTDYILVQYFEQYAKDINSYQHIGDIEELKVFYKDTIYLIQKENKCVAFFHVLEENNNALFEVAYVIPEMRRQKITSLFVWFLKRNQGYSKIIFGDKHSINAVDTVKEIGHRFNLYWIKDNDIQPFDPDTISQYYSLEHPTGWKLMLENNGNFTNWPKYFNNKIPDTRCFYRCMLQE